MYLLDLILPYIRFSLVLCCAYGVYYHWRKPDKRRPYLYTGATFVLVYILDMLRELDCLTFLTDQRWASLRPFIAVAALTAAYWALLWADVLDPYRASYDPRRVSGWRRVIGYWWAIVLLLGTLLMVVGCTPTPSLKDVVDALNERQWSHCSKIEGSFPPYAHVQIFGRAGQLDCQALWFPQYAPPANSIVIPERSTITIAPEAPR